MDELIVWKPCNNELYRCYIFPDGSEVRIEEPIKVGLKKKHRDWGGNGHRLIDSRGVCHYVPPGWIHLYWVVKEGIVYEWWLGKREKPNDITKE